MRQAFLVVHDDLVSGNWSSSVWYRHDWPDSRGTVCMVFSLCSCCLCDSFIRHYVVPQQAVLVVHSPEFTLSSVLNDWPDNRGRAYCMLSVQLLFCLGQFHLPLCPNKQFSLYTVIKFPGTYCHRFWYWHDWPDNRGGAYVYALSAAAVQSGTISSAIMQRDFLVVHTTIVPRSLYMRFDKRMTEQTTETQFNILRKSAATAGCAGPVSSSIIHQEGQVVLKNFWEFRLHVETHKRFKRTVIY